MFAFGLTPSHKDKPRKKSPSELAEAKLRIELRRAQAESRSRAHLYLVPKVTEKPKVDPLVALKEEFSQELSELLDRMSNCNNKTDWTEVIRIRMTWTSKKRGCPGLRERVHQYAAEHGISKIAREPYFQAIYEDARWRWFKNHVLPRYRKAKTGPGKKLRKRANKRYRKGHPTVSTPDKLSAHRHACKKSYYKRKSEITEKQHARKLAKRRKLYAKKHPKA